MLEEWVPNVDRNKNEKKRDNVDQDERPFIHKSVQEFVYNFDQINTFA